MTLDMEAMLFAYECHKGHLRKYTKEPYFSHLAQVVGLVSSLYDKQHILATAWLHDCVEDCDVTHLTLQRNFGIDVADGVISLSDLETGNREERKRLSRERLSKCAHWIQDIKVCDLISNTGSIVIHDPKFAELYLEEKRLCLDVLTKADKRLLKIARSQLILDSSAAEHVAVNHGVEGSNPSQGAN